MTDQQLLVMALMDEGASRDEALAAVAFDPTSTERLAPAIAAQRAKLEERIAREEQEAYAASPEGRAAAARQALADQAARAELVAGAKALLAGEQGIDAEGLSDAEVLHAAGVERNVSLMSRAELDSEHEALAARWRSLSAMEQATQASELGIDSASVERYVRVMEGDDTPVTPQWGEGVEGGGDGGNEG